MTESTKLVTELIADSSKFTAGIKTAKAEAFSLTSTIKNGSVVAIAAFTALAGAATFVGNEIFKAAEKVSKLYDDTQKIGTTVAAFQELAIAAREAGVSSDNLQNLLGTMNKKLGEAQLSGGRAKLALNALGITLQELRGLKADQQFELIASKLRLVHDLTLETALASDIFGKNGKNGIALFNSNIDESVKKVRELGITLTQSQAEGLDKLSETKDLIGSIWEGFKNNVAADLAPAFQEILDGIIQSVKGMGGLKEAAKSTADFIVGAMNAMKIAIDTAVTSMKLAKSIADDLGVTKLYNIARDQVSLAIESFAQIFNENVAGTNKIFQHILPSNSKYRDGGPIFGSSSSTTNPRPDSGANTAISQATKNVNKFTQSIDLSSQTLDTYKISLFNSSTALKSLVSGAVKASNALFEVGKIQEALNAPGKKQAESIINTSVKDLGIQLAPTEAFQSMFTKALRDAKTGNLSGAEDLIPKLQAIIDREGNKNAFTSFENEAGAGSYDTGIRQDVSGLTSALSDLKAFLSQKTNQEQRVKVDINVNASDNFITNITTSTSFKDAVDGELNAYTAAAARGTLP